MAASEWIYDGDDEEEDGFVDPLSISSDPVGLAADQFLLMADGLKAEGLSRIELMAAMSLAMADLAHEMLD